MAQNITYQLRWQVGIHAVPIGSGPQEVPTAQRMALNQASASGGGPISVTSTGNYPLQADFNTACTTMRTNVEAAIAQVLSTLQGWNSGNP